MKNVTGIFFGTVFFLVGLRFVVGGAWRFYDHKIDFGEYNTIIGVVVSIVSVLIVLEAVIGKKSRR